MEPAIPTPLPERPGPRGSLQVDTAWTDESVGGRRDAPLHRPYGNGERT
ncbi:hypothetical protein HW130_03865 [Streptomyces sp. PKU-EA00015]|nr:hypothetical protein [Streptomyces sp. PKU-EA00015]NWF25406.1 hypothetical protein [Streptomyces sp. PKU-EA00015]